MNSIAKVKVAGVIILYNPDVTVQDNIKSYFNELDLLFVIDNSETKRIYLEELISDPKVIYKPQESNIGIAEAINIAAELALQSSFDYLLTMDQDSSFKDGDFAKLLVCLNEIDRAKVGVLSPLHVHKLVGNKSSQVHMAEVDMVMTSGNLLNLRSYVQAGPFMSLLFIDHVDHEYCLRLRSIGYQIMVVKDIHLIHSLGHKITIDFLRIIKLRFVSHQPIRIYYMIRNGFYVARKYKKTFPDFARINNKLVIKEIIKILFEQQKLKRLKMVLLAVVHFRSHKMGKLNA